MIEFGQEQGTPVREWVSNFLLAVMVGVVLAFLLLAPEWWVSLAYVAVPYTAVAVLFAFGALVSWGSYKLAPMPVVRNFMWICLYGSIIFTLFALELVSPVRQLAMARFLVLALLLNGVYAHWLQRLIYIVEPLDRAGVLPPLPWWAQWWLKLARWYNQWREQGGRDD
jgi:hypothetical protein